ncbi:MULTISPECIES: RICIN domain-containing protein [Streptomycetaceae]|uniref:RICIN domain-containing protein n=1 Tax=Streptomycetaceae TaxID=2062 RepID=UPI000938AE15|nr:ricin-type beta-trefoil lectin domain protein [Streptomyces sp. CB02056]
MIVHKKLAAVAVATAALVVGATGAASAQGAGSAESAGGAGHVAWSQGQAPGTQSGTQAGALTAGLYVRIYSLYRGTTGQCLDADATNGGNGTRVQVWGCNGTAQQEWFLSTDGSLENVRFPGMCLDADTNGGGGNGTRVQLWQCNGTTQQKWYHPSGDLAIYNVRYNNGNNTVLDRDINVAGDGAQTQLWVKNFQSQQWWDIRTA